MISIIIPTLNEEKVIKKILENLSRCSGEKEIIVSDGNSSDKTVEIAKQYTNKVIVYAGETRQTIGGGRNVGAGAAKGEFLVFLDADISITDPNDFFSRAESFFLKDKNLVGMTVRIRVLKEIETIGDWIVFRSPRPTVRSPGSAGTGSWAGVSSLCLFADAR